MILVGRKKLLKIGTRRWGWWFNGKRSDCGTSMRGQENGLWLVEEGDWVRSGCFFRRCRIDLVLFWSHLHFLAHNLPDRNNGHNTQPNNAIDSRSLSRVVLIRKQNAFSCPCVLVCYPINNQWEMRPTDNCGGCKFSHPSSAGAADRSNKSDGDSESRSRPYKTPRSVGVDLVGSRISVIQSTVEIWIILPKVISRCSHIECSIFKSSVVVIGCRHRRQRSPRLHKVVARRSACAWMFQFLLTIWAGSSHHQTESRVKKKVRTECVPRRNCVW